MNLLVSIKPPSETLDYLENCIEDLAHLNKRAPIKWSDRSMLFSTIISFDDIEEELVKDVNKALKRVVNTLSTFFIDLTSPELTFKRERPYIVYMNVFDQSGMLEELYNGLIRELQDKISIDPKIKFFPHLNLGKVKGIIPRKKKVNIKTGHIDAIFPVHEVELVQKTLTSIGPLYTTLHTEKISNE